MHKKMTILETNFLKLRKISEQKMHNIFRNKTAKIMLFSKTLHSHSANSAEPCTNGKFNWEGPLNGKLAFLFFCQFLILWNS
jgi:hypothetical protein